MNYVNLATRTYKKLHEVAPGSDAGKRFLRDIASWAMFSLLARLCSATGRADEREYNDRVGLAALVGIGCRSDGPNWFEEALANTAQRLADPTFRERAATAEQEWAATRLSDSDLKRAARLQEAGNRTMAARRAAQAGHNAAAMPGALLEFRSLMNASNAFARGAPLVADFGPTMATKMLEKVNKALDSLPSALYTFGDPVGAAILRAAIDRHAFDEVLEPFQPAFDDSWIADNEIASLEAEEEGNFARHQHELRSIADEVQARTDGYRALVG